MEHPRLQGAATRAVRAGVVLTLLFALHALLGGSGDAVDRLFERGVYNVVLVLASAVIAARGLTAARERGAWVLLGLGLLAWTSANTYYSLFLAHSDDIPIPSVADALWLGFYPPAYLAMMLLVRSRVSGLRRGMWLDGVIGAFAVAAPVTATALEISLQPGLGGSIAEVATNLAYPLGDMILLGVVTLVMALDGWRLERAWVPLALGFLIFASADAVYFWQVAGGTYVSGRLVDAGWLAAALLYAAAALQPAPPRRESSSDGQRALLLPMASACSGSACWSTATSPRSTWPRWRWRRCAC